MLEFITLFNNGRGKGNSGVGCTSLYFGVTPTYPAYKIFQLESQAVTDFAKFSNPNLTDKV